MFPQHAHDRDRERTFHDLELLGQFDDAPRVTQGRRPEPRRWAPRLIIHRANILAGTR